LGLASIDSGLAFGSPAEEVAAAHLAAVDVQRHRRRGRVLSSIPDELASLSRHPARTSPLLVRRSRSAPKRRARPRSSGDMSPRTVVQAPGLCPSASPGNAASSLPSAAGWWRP